MSGITESSRLVFGRFSVRISAGTPVNSHAFRGFISHTRQMPECYLEWLKTAFFQILPDSLYHSALYSLATECRQKNRRRKIHGLWIL
jgi:hypothetical protein